MDPTILAALIGAGATIIAALIAVRASRPLWAGDERPPQQDPRPTNSVKGGARSPSLPHQSVTEFWLQYWRRAQAEFPALSMKRPDQVPAGSDWPQFRNAELGGGRRIVHKWSEGFVDLEVQGAGEKVDQIRAQNKALLPSDMEVVHTTKSASFRLTVPKINRFGDFTKQIAAVRAGLGAAARLLALAPQIES